MSTQELTATNNAQRVPVATTDQYTLWQILGIWGLVSLPMALLAWVTVFVKRIVDHSIGETLTSTSLR